MKTVNQAVLECYEHLGIPVTPESLNKRVRAGGWEGAIIKEPFVDEWKYIFKKVLIGEMKMDSFQSERFLSMMMLPIYPKLVHKIKLCISQWMHPEITADKCTKELDSIST